MSKGIIQNFKTSCVDCGEDAISRAIDFTGENEIIIDFLELTEFKCESCGCITEIVIEKQ